MVKPTLSKVEKQELAQYVAGVGENYERYKEYAQARSWYIFTPAYFRRWVQNHRNMVRKYRAQHQVEVRRLSTLGKEERIQQLELDLDAINTILASDNLLPHDCDCGGIHGSAKPADTVRLLEQKRRTLQAIAQERGEWNKASEETPPEKGSSVLGSEVFDSLATEKKGTLDSEQQEIEERSSLEPIEGNVRQ